MAKESCVAQSEKTDLFNADCPFETIHSKCYVEEKKLWDHGNKWRIPASMVPSCQQHPDDRVEAETIKNNDEVVTVIRESDQFLN